MKARLMDQKRNGQYPFVYTPACATDLSVTFARVRQQMEKRNGSRLVAVPATARKGTT